MTRPLLIDLYCCGGGAAMGYHQAGFDVIGVDLHPQPHYPFPFIQGDALNPPVDLTRAALIHASPPCQFATAYRRRPGVAPDARDLIATTRRLLERSGRPYVIENVEGAAASLRNPIRLCGSSFGLNVRRHRLFETSWPTMSVPCDHGWQTPRFPPATNRTNLRCTVEVGVWRIPLETQQEAMGVDWLPLDRLSQAIPPAFTRHIGQQFLTRLEAAA